MLLKFTKMHGLGNDFIIINATINQINLSKKHIQWLSDRHLGIGCDQLLIVEKIEDKWADFRYRIFNADGSEVEQCGNGARCFAKFVVDEGLTTKKKIPVIASGRRIVLELKHNGLVEVDMGIPQFEPCSLPFLRDRQSETYTLALSDNIKYISQLSESYIEENQRLVVLSAVSVGNPHVVLLVNNVNEAPVKTVGKLIESHSDFPQSVNVGFMQIIHRKHIRLRVFERAVGETKACGTGACAAVVTGIKRGLLDDNVNVDLIGGQLTINWSINKNNHSVMMTGPAEKVFTGTIHL